MPSEPKNAPDLSPAVVRDEEPWYTKPCTCGHSARDHIDMGAPQLGSCITCDCRAFRDPASPVSVPEERQDDPLTLCQDTGATAVRGACPIHGGDACLVFVPGLVAALKDRTEKIARQQSALDALAVAVKGCGLALGRNIACGERAAGYTHLCRNCSVAREQSITSLLDGRTLDA